MYPSTNRDFARYATAWGNSGIEEVTGCVSGPIWDTLRTDVCLLIIIEKGSVISS